MDEAELASALGIGISDRILNECRYELYTLHSDGMFFIQSTLSDFVSRHACHRTVILGLETKIQAHIAPLVQDYIWQRQPFNLHTCIFNSSSSTPPPWYKASSKTGALLPTARPAADHFLWGRVEFGDNVEDEWFIAWLLMDITRHFPSVVARIWDDDGEFLLIEAAFSLPRWLTPEAASNRVWLSNGSIHLIPLTSNNSSSSSSSGNDDSNNNGNSTTQTLTQTTTIYQKPDWGEDTLTAQAAVAAIAHVPSLTATTGLVVHAGLQERLAGYPERAHAQMHRTAARVPAKLAYMLRTDPLSVAAAIELFHYRDPYAIKVARKMQYFPFVDIVTCSVRMSRCLYAQIALQEYHHLPSGGYQGKEKDEDGDDDPAAAAAAAERLGIKLAAGYEMLLHYSKNGSRNSKGEINSALNSEYVGQEVHPRVLRCWEEAGAKMDVEALKREGSSVPPAESDAWLHDAPELMEAELKKREEEVATAAAAKEEKEKKKNNTATKKENEEFDPTELMDKMKMFMGMMDAMEEAEKEGGEVDREEERSSTAGVEWDESKFVAELKRVLLLSPEDDSGDSEESDEGSSFYGNDDDDSDDDDDNVEEGEEKGEFGSQYEAVMSQQLADTSLSQSFVTAEAAVAGDDFKTADQMQKQKQTSEVALRPIDVDTNLVASLLGSYYEQEGGPGPAGNLAGLLGIELPRSSNDPHHSSSNANASSSGSGSGSTTKPK